MFLEQRTSYFQDLFLAILQKIPEVFPHYLNKIISLVIIIQFLFVKDLQGSFSHPIYVNETIKKNGNLRNSTDSFKKYNIIK